MIRVARRRPLALLGMVAVWLLLLCGPVLAHAQLSESEPAAGETVAESPEQVRLRFNEPVDAAFSPLKVYDSSGERVDEDDARKDPGDARAVEASLEELTQGTYTVEYRVTSVDGHVVEDTYDFSVISSGDSGEAEGDGVGEPGAVETEAGSWLHYLHYTVLGIGAVVLLAIALRRR
jgi:methionine-rich copper-binding protein CopC